MTKLIIDAETHKLYAEWVARYQEKYQVGANDVFEFAGICLLLKNGDCPYTNPDCTNCEPAIQTLETLYEDARSIVLNPHLDAEVGQTKQSGKLITQHRLRASQVHNPTLQVTAHNGNGHSKNQKVEISVF